MGDEIHRRDAVILRNAKLRYGANLPHLTADYGIYAITFRLVDALPQSVIRELGVERNNLIKSGGTGSTTTSVGVSSPSILRQLSCCMEHPIEKYLDCGKGECWMNRSPIAQLVEDALKKFDGLRYDLLSWCVMPNHVHAVIFPYPAHNLSDIGHSWKSYTAQMSNKLLHRAGAFWQAESYDRLIRDIGELEHTLDYVKANPAEAGLKDWRWVGENPQISQILEKIARLRQSEG